MNLSPRSIPVNYSNISVMLSGTNKAQPYGEFAATPCDDRYAYEPAIAQVKSKDMYLSNFSMRVSEGKFSRDVVFNDLGDAGLNLIGSCFILKGEFTTRQRNNPNVVRSFDGSQNFKYDPNNEMTHSCEANNPFHIVHFSVLPEHFIQFLPENESWPEQLVNKMTRRDSLMGDHYAPITIAQQRALQNILDCPLTGKLGQWMIETSIAQIIVMQLGAIFHQKNSNKKLSLAKPDLELANGVKDYLQNTFSQDHGLDELAKTFGTNTNKLTSTFKKAFGKNIFEFIAELKMEHAYHLLKNENKRIMDVSREIGYKNPNHFSAAFKRKFGMSPSQVA